MQLFILMKDCFMCRFAKLTTSCNFSIPSAFSKKKMLKTNIPLFPMLQQYYWKRKSPKMLLNVYLF